MKRYPPSGPAFADVAGSVRQIRLGGKFTPAVVFLLGLYTVTYLLSKLPRVGEFISEQLLLRPAQALGPRPYQLLSAPLLMTSFLSLVFLGFLLWSVGSAVEQKLGPRRLLLWAGLCSLAAGIAAAGMGRLLPGYGFLPVVLDGSALFQLVLVAFARYYGDIRMSLWEVTPPVSGRAISYFWVAIWLFMDLWARRWLDLTAATTAVLCALLLCHGGSRLWTPLRRLGRRRKLPSGFGVIDGGRAGSGPRGPKSPQRWVN
jgi:membrane associated rhomboid family serine protease